MLINNYDNKMMESIDKQSLFTKENKMQFTLLLKELLRGEIETKTKTIYNFKHQSLGEITYKYNVKKQQAYITETAIAQFLAWPCSPKKYFVFVPQCFVRANINGENYFLYSDTLEFFLICLKETSIIFRKKNPQISLQTKGEMLAEMFGISYAKITDYIIVDGKKYIDFPTIQAFLGKKKLIRSTDYIQYGFSPIKINGRYRFEATINFLAFLQNLKNKRNKLVQKQ